MAALLGCGPEQPVWTPQALQESYEQTLADIRDVLSERLPALQWGEQKPAAAYRSGWSCIATYASYGSRVGLHQWEDDLERAVGDVIAEHGFGELKDEGGGTGGWVTHTSADDRGVTLTILSKGSVEVHMGAPVDDSYCD